VSLAIGILSVLLMCTNFVCVAHNHMHNPFFSDKRLNTLFGVFNSLLIGNPSSLYRVHHLNHHRHNNDAFDPRTGSTKDIASTWRYGRPPEEEGIMKYALFACFRNDLSFLFREVRSRRLLAKVALESLALLAMVLVFATLNPLGLVVFYLPVWFLGNVGVYAENYTAHHGAIPGDRMKDSVSCYGKLYNLIWFNNGYHQEHHYRPQVHWTRLAEVKPLLPPESERRVVRGAHWFNVGHIPVRRHDAVAHDAKHVLFEVSANPPRAALSAAQWPGGIGSRLSTSAVQCACQLEIASRR
jgi:fatty acid desaturase